jgi:hypothetical protein
MGSPTAGRARKRQIVLTLRANGFVFEGRASIGQETISKNNA